MDFILHSGTRYHVHSPFIYSLIEQVVLNKETSSAVSSIEKLRKDMLQDRHKILKTDFGAGAEKAAAATYSMYLRDIARTSSTRRRHALRLHHLARHTKALSILELGTSLGITTAYLATSSEDTRVISLEGCPELCRIARTNLSRLGIGNVEIMQGEFTKSLPVAIEYMGCIDLVYIDGDHRKDSVIRNFEMVLPFLHNDSVVILDDIHHTHGMEKAWEHILGRDEVRISLDFFFSGWLFFRRECSKEHFKLRHL
jgi:predicted O-methyltransferase YrrM